MNSVEPGVLYIVCLFAAKRWGAAVPGAARAPAAAPTCTGGSRVRAEGAGHCRFLHLVIIMFLTLITDSIFASVRCDRGSSECVD